MSVLAMGREIEMPTDGVAPMGLQEVSNAFFVVLGAKKDSGISLKRGCHIKKGVIVSESVTVEILRVILSRRIFRF